MTLRRRTLLLQALGLASMTACSPSGTAPPSQGGVIALDWALAETLLALGRPPAGVVAAADWARFVVEPELPANVADLGLQQDLNFELIAALRPGLILISPFLGHLDATLRRIAPTLNLSIYKAAQTPLANRMHVTRELATRLGVPEAADRVIAGMEAVRVDALARLTGLRKRPLVFLSMIDNRHARVYSGGSLYADVLGWLGLENGWQRPVGAFGFATIGIEQLAVLDDIELVVVEPVPPAIDRALASSPLWTQLAFVRAGHQGTLPPIFMFGALPSAARMARLLVPYLQRRWA